MGQTIGRWKKYVNSAMRYLTYAAIGVTTDYYILQTSGENLLKYEFFLYSTAVSSDAYND